MAKHRAPFLNNEVISLTENNKTPEQKLWIAVLAKAFDDAFKSSDEGAALDALRWIRHGSVFKQMQKKNARKNVSCLHPRPKTKKTFIKKDYKWLPKYSHTYVDR